MVCEDLKVSQSPAIARNENKLRDIHEEPKLAGRRRKAVKLIRRDLGNLINAVLLEAASAEYAKKVNNLKSTCARSESKNKMD